MAKKETKMSKKIMDDIDNEELQMHSKTYFRVLNLALVGVSGLFLMLSTLLLLIAARDIKYGDTLGFRHYGARGYGEFLQTLPWLAIVFGLLAILISYTLIKHFDFTYKHRLYTVIGALLFAVAGLSVVLATTGIEGALSKTGPFEGLRTFSRFSEEHSVAGEVVHTDADKIVIFSTEGETVSIYLTDDTKARYLDYKVGEVLFVVGDRQEDGSFEAYGIRKGERPPPPHVKGTNRRILK